MTARTLVILFASWLVSACDTTHESGDAASGDADIRDASGDAASEPDSAPREVPDASVDRLDAWIPPVDGGCSFAASEVTVAVTAGAGTDASQCPASFFGTALRIEATADGARLAVRNETCAASLCECLVTITGIGRMAASSIALDTTHRLEVHSTPSGVVIDIPTCASDTIATCPGAALFFATSEVAGAPPALLAGTHVTLEQGPLHCTLPGGAAANDLIFDVSADAMHTGRDVALVGATTSIGGYDVEIASPFVETVAGADYGVLGFWATVPYGP